MLDDLQAVTEPDRLASLAYALGVCRRTLRIVALTRATRRSACRGCAPPATLAELRADELAFTAAEARELLVERHGLELGRG